MQTTSPVDLGNLIESDFMLRKKQNHGTTQTKKNEFGRGMKKGDTGWEKTSINC